MSALMLNVSKAIRSYHRSTVNDGSGSDRTAFPDDHIGIEHAVVAHRAIGPDEDPGIQRHPRADGHAVSQRDEGPDGGVGPDRDAGSLRDVCCNASRSGRPDKKRLGHLRKGEEWIGNDDLRNIDF